MTATPAHRAHEYFLQWTTHRIYLTTTNRQTILIKTTTLQSYLWSTREEDLLANPRNISSSTQEFLMQKIDLSISYAVPIKPSSSIRNSHIGTLQLNHHKGISTIIQIIINSS